MKILHVVGIGKLPRNPESEAAGGLTRVALEIARLQATQGHEVVVAAVARSAWRERWQGVWLVSLAAMPRVRARLAGLKIDLSTLLPLLRFTVRQGFDVIHAHEYCYLRYLPAGIRITHFHNDIYSHPAGDDVAAWEASECLAAARYSHAHVAVSRFIAQQLLYRYQSIVAHLPIGFDPASRIHVVYNGVDLEWYDPGKWREDRQRLRHSWGITADEITFVYSGAVAPDKGVLQLARAFTALSQTTLRARLVLAGHAGLWEDQSSRTGPNPQHEAYYRSVTDELSGLIDRGRVVVLGLVPPSVLPSVYAAADVVVVPSIVQEAFCLSAAEGLAMAKPLLASRVGGLVEFAAEENSVLVPPLDEGP